QARLYGGKPRQRTSSPVERSLLRCFSERRAGSAGSTDVDAQAEQTRLYGGKPRQCTSSPVERSLLRCFSECQADSAVSTDTDPWAERAPLDASRAPSGHSGRFD